MIELINSELLYFKAAVVRKDLPQSLRGVCKYQTMGNVCTILLRKNVIHSESIL